MSLMMLNSTTLNIIDLEQFKDKIEYRYEFNEEAEQVLYEAKLVTAIHREWRPMSDDTAETREAFQKQGAELIHQSLRNHLNSIRRFIDVQLLFEEMEATDE